MKTTKKNTVANVTTTSKVDFFWRAQNNNPVKMFSDANVRNATVEVPRTLVEANDLGEMLKIARVVGVPMGTFQSGIYEVQTDKGIWSRADAMRLDVSTPRKAEKCVFKTWEQLEAEDAAEQELNRQRKFYHLVHTTETQH